MNKAIRLLALLLVSALLGCASLRSHSPISVEGTYIQIDNPELSLVIQDGHFRQGGTEAAAEGTYHAREIGPDTYELDVDYHGHLEGNSETVVVRKEGDQVVISDKETGTERKYRTKPYAGSKEIERMKSLVGAWKGQADMGEGPMDITVEYRVVAGGSAIEERFFAGTPKEMITMYHDDNKGKLALTHYCMLHNRPAMRLKSSTEDSLEFDFDPASDIQVKTEMHMHSMTLKFNADKSITHIWTLFEGGKAKDEHPFTFSRVDS